MLLLKNEKELKKIVSDIGKYNLELYVKQVLSLKMNLSNDILKYLVVILGFDSSKRFCIVGILDSEMEEKTFDEYICLYPYSGILSTGSRRHGYISLNESLYEEIEVYKIKNGMLDNTKERDYTQWIKNLNIDFFQKIPDDSSLEEEYRWIK